MSTLEGDNDRICGELSAMALLSNDIDDSNNAVDIIITYGDDSFFIVTSKSVSPAIRRLSTTSSEND
jgi:hypothetical protein